MTNEGNASDSIKTKQQQDDLKEGFFPLFKTIHSKIKIDELHFRNPALKLTEGNVDLYMAEIRNNFTTFLSKNCKPNVFLWPPTNFLGKCITIKTAL